MVKGGGASQGSVLHFVSDWLPASEGFVYDLIRHLERPALVITPNKIQNRERFPLDDVHSLVPLYRIVRPASLRPRVVTAALGLLARHRHVDLVHVHHGYGIEHVLGVVRQRRLPLVLSLHGHDVTGYLEHRPDAYLQTIDQVAAVVVPSRFLVPHAVAAGFDPACIYVLPSGIDTTFFSPTPLPGGPPTVVFIGRFVKKKGIDVLGAAWPAVQAAVPSAHLKVYGFGPLEGLARAIPGNVSVELAPDRVAVRDAIRAATVVVSPSHHAADDAVESLLVVNLEAQASGRPVVTTRHGGIPEYVRDGETALVVEENDVDALAHALVRLLEDSDLASRLAAGGPPAVSGLDLHLTAARMDALYDSLIG